jgi:hypothetical protein
MCLLAYVTLCAACLDGIFGFFPYMETCSVTLCGDGQRPVLSLYVILYTEQVSEVLVFERVRIVPKNAF